MEKNTISLLLLKEQFNESNAFKDQDSKEYEGRSLDEYLNSKGIRKFSIEDKILYYRKSKSVFPKWDSFFKKALSKDLSDKNPFKTGGMLSAIFFVKIPIPGDDSRFRTFVITFGAGRFF